MHSCQTVLNNWTKVSHKRGRSKEGETEREAKHDKESKHWLKQTSTSHRYTTLQQEESGRSAAESRP
jgi:hypothetical protein